MKNEREIKIETISEWLPAEDLKNINDLIPDLSKRLAARLGKLDQKDIAATTNLDLHYMFVARAVEDPTVLGPIVGMTTLCLRHPLSGVKGTTEDVVVSKDHQGKGIGRMLMQKLIETARDNKAHFISLTSKPDKKPAHKLYESLGFKKVAAAVDENGTDYFRLYF